MQGVRVWKGKLEKDRGPNRMQEVKREKKRKAIGKVKCWESKMDMAAVGFEPTPWRLEPAPSSESASAGNRTRVTAMATMYSATRPLMLLLIIIHRCRSKIHDRAKETPPPGIEPGSSA